MRWRGRRQSDNVEDRRGMGGGAVMGGGIGMIVIFLIGAFLGVNPQKLAGIRGGPAKAGGAKKKMTKAEIESGNFAAVVLADTEDVWTKLFAEAGRKYTPPKMVLFTGKVTSACGAATSASGPFYCPGDQKVYLDTSFFVQMEKQLNAPGDFAQAYVIAHEVGHHVQNILGYTNKVERVRRTKSKVEANRASVRLELQADFFAGCMLNHAQRTKGIIESGDIEEALRAATAIGDDRLQQKSRGGYVDVESFTHLSLIHI